MHTACITQNVQPESRMQASNTSTVPQQCRSLESYTSCTVVLADQVVALSGDITAAEAPATIAEALKAEFGRVDVLVNNAGGQQQQQSAAVSSLQPSAVSSSSHQTGCSSLCWYVVYTAKLTLFFGESSFQGFVAA